ncbi:16806_t:CDS:2 [Funneliformis geosporum]|uniref:16806_t:CDS:1 n=1 Tax=Funneliformis geosporum TaxID=1117311 RepID=A0A9W4WW79_9GLOM|nr:16806_t:CDS:2 [Funneliformis geosporum]
MDIGLSEEDADFAKWLSKTKKLTPEKVLNHGNSEELREEYYKTPQQIKKPGLSPEQKKALEEYRKSLKELGKSNNLEEFLNSDYRELYEAEAEELEKSKEKKENLGTNQTQTIGFRSRGKGVLEQGPVIKEDSPNSDGTPKNLMQSNRMHYDFCSNLGIKRIYQSEFSSYQPRFSLFRAFGKGKGDAEDEINRNPS